MRPPEFTGGNQVIGKSVKAARTFGFNEAAGIHRRKPGEDGRGAARLHRASMRPPEFTGGNASVWVMSTGMAVALQ